MTKAVRQGLIWLLHLENGLSTAEVATLAQKSRRTVQVCCKAARDFLDHTSNLDWLELVMRGVDSSNCTHPMITTKGKVTYCLWCGWVSHPNDPRVHREKPKLHQEAAQTAKEVQPKGAAKFRPKIRAKQRKT